MSTSCRNNIIGYLYESYIVLMYGYIQFGWLTETFKYCTKIFYQLLTDYLCYIYSLRQSVVGKT